ncbi:hypothetical protein [Paraherbaspirillum soli]|uniref:YXWGXW repeat-containing protein n=1 Tax=Paraherbaspirillum soli TaxID=631222 RepID=A0ABW0M4K8_9BURK
MKRREFQRYCLSALAAASTLSLAGCVVEPPRTHVVYKEVRVAQAPPAPLQEVMPPAPYPDAYWIAGHWKWEGNRYVWSNGHWEQARQNMVFQHAYWSLDGGQWNYHPGRWVAISPSYNTAPIVVNVAPPAPRVEIITQAPSPNHVWIGGYWRWDNGQHNWVNGHWETRRDGYFWAPGHWIRSGSGWAFSGGFWQRY